MTKASLLTLYEKIFLIRRAQEKIAALYPEGKMRLPVHLCMGEEAISAGVCLALRTDDYAVGFYRSHGHFLAKGGDPKKLFAELYGKATGAMGGRGGSMNLADVSIGLMGTSAIVGGGLGIGVGLALASALRRDRRVTVIFFGDAAAEEGVFHESLNFSSLKKLPIVFVCENNGYAVMSPLKNRQPSAAVSRFAAAHCMESISVDGNDAVAVAAAAARAIARARTGKGPTLLECHTRRVRGHIESFIMTTDNRSPKEIAAARRTDPVTRFSRYLQEQQAIDASILEKIEKRVDKQIDEAVAYAESSPLPDPKTLLEYV